jgi:hypothetical protein
VYVRLSQNGKVSPYMGLSARPGSGGNLIEVPWQTTPVTDTNLTYKISPPRIGASVPTAMVGSTQYNGTVTWSPDDSVFWAGSTYTARVILTANSGYTFNGVGPFSHTSLYGTTVTVISNTYDSVTIDIAFPVILSEYATYFVDLGFHISLPQEGYNPPGGDFMGVWNGYQQYYCYALEWRAGLGEREEQEVWPPNKPIEDVANTPYHAYITLESDIDIFTGVTELNFVHPAAAVEVLDIEDGGYRVEVRLSFYMP